MRLCTVTTGQMKPAAVSFAIASATPGIKVSSSSRSCFSVHQSTVQIEKHAPAAHFLIVRRVVHTTSPSDDGQLVSGILSGSITESSIDGS
jgi:hypothetical protein